MSDVKHLLLQFTSESAMQAWVADLVKNGRLPPKVVIGNVTDREYYMVLDPKAGMPVVVGEVALPEIDGRTKLRVLGDDAEGIVFDCGQTHAAAGLPVPEEGGGKAVQFTGVPCPNCTATFTFQAKADVESANGQLDCPACGQPFEFFFKADEMGTREVR